MIFQQDSKKTSEEFFKDLLNETQEVFKHSPIYRLQIEHQRKWNYAICGTPIQKNQGIILGINWGGNECEPQSKMPTGEGISKYSFIKQSRFLLENWLEIKISNPSFNYTNLCFFRSPYENYLTKKDYLLSIPLFERYVKYINPPWIFSIGNINMKILDSQGLLYDIKRHFDDEKKYKGHSSKLWGYDLFDVPHPNARISRKARITIWEKVIDSMREKV